MRIDAAVEARRANAKVPPLDAELDGEWMWISRMNNAPNNALVGAVASPSAST